MYQFNVKEKLLNNLSAIQHYHKSKINMIVYLEEKGTWAFILMKCKVYQTILSRREKKQNPF